MEKQARFTNKKLLFNKSIDFPELPGVYKFFNSENKILYIGKAKNIKNRVKSYLNIRKGEGKRIAKLKASIKYIETIITKTESDALILEQGLISKVRPPYNIQFRDDKLPCNTFIYFERFSSNLYFKTKRSHIVRFLVLLQMLVQ